MTGSPGAPPNWPPATVTDPETQTLGPEAPAASDTDPAPGRSLPTFLPGEVVAGRFEIVRFLGQGGMGQVFEAQDRELRARVALKVIRPEIAGRRRIIEAFKREIQLARQVTHPNVCRLFDLFHHTSAADRGWGRGAPSVLLVTMELLDGETLTQRLRRSGPFEPAQALPILDQMAAALDAAHRAGVVHRDFKGANVVLVEGDSGPRAVVTDFGLARDRHAQERRQGPRQATSFGGTPAYVAPEVVAGGPATAASDIYAFGVVIYEMMTGEVPFRGDTPEATARLRLEQAPPAPRQLRPSLDPAWEAAILRCLGRQPEARFRSAGEAVIALEGGATGAREPRAARPRRRRRGAAAVLAAALALTSYLSYLSRGEHPEPPAEAARTSERRPAVAVLGFENRSAKRHEQGPELAWIGTSVAELLTAQLGAGGALRMIPGERVARMKAEFSWDRRPPAQSNGDLSPGDLSPGDLERLQDYLGSDFVIFGSYTAGVAAAAEPVRLELELRSTATGTALAHLDGEGRVEQLAELVSDLGSGLRARLGVEPIATGGADPTQPDLPVDPAAARLFARGLDQLRRLDHLAARDLLTQAAREAPGSAAVHAALAAAWAGLGDDAQSTSAARQAFELAADLPREQRLLHEARYRQTTNDWPRALEIYRALWTVFSDNPEHGLRLVAAETLAGSSAEALATLEAVRGNAPSGDPRIDLAEAEAARVRGELERQLEAANRAGVAGDALGAPLLVAQARLLEAEALDALGRPAEAATATAAARAIFEARGDQRGLALALLSRADGAEAGLDVELGLTYEQARAIFRRIGDRENEIRAVVQMVRPLMARSETQPEAETLLREALSLARRVGNRPAEVEALNALGYLAFVRNELRRAAEVFDAAVVAARASGNLRKLVENLQNAAATADVLQDLEGSAERFDEAILAARKIGYRFGTGMILRNSALVELRRGNLDLSLERLGEAAEIARDVDSEQLLALASYDLGVLRILRAELDLAREELERAESLWQARGEGGGAAARLQRAEVLLAEERYQEAEELLRELLPGFPLDSATDLALQARGSLALALLWQGRVAEARPLILAAQAAVPDQRWDLKTFCAQIAALTRAATGEATVAADQLQDLSAEAKALGQTTRRLSLDLFLALALFADGRDAEAQDLLRTVIHEAKSCGLALIARQAQDVLSGRRRLPAPTTTSFGNRVLQERALTSG